ncbi:uncharacterized protein VTP21DRAFT_5211 [Calcarisporiella thermophila]|uniref:uncharacterized protein n=1 Tax=Calcarisporiella thermophila TaxID=911321 RepID=UPI003743A363
MTTPSSNSNAALDMSLDDIISSQPRTNIRGRGRGFVPNRGGFGGRGGGFVRGGVNKRYTRPTPYGAARTAYMTPHYAMGGVAGMAGGQNDPGSKIFISNLHFNVTEQDLKELFGTQIGPLRKVTLNFDQSGQSKGTAAIVFARSVDASRAFQKFHNVTLDGRPMKIEIVLNPGQAAANTLSSTPQAGLQNNGFIPRGGIASRAGRGGMRGGFRGGRGARGAVSTRPTKSAEELDAEMDSYMQTDSPTPISAAPTTEGAAASQQIQNGGSTA